MKNIIILLVVVLVVVGGYVYFNKGEEKVPVAEVVEDTNSTIQNATTTQNVKEFTIVSWMETKDGKMSPHFSLAEMRVKKGDRVKISITNTAGTHDFVLDE